MSVKIRFARFGLKHQPRYRIVVANSFAKRDGKHIEWIGSYNPFPSSSEKVKLCQLHFERAKYWLGVGAQPTEPVQRLFAKAGLLPSIPRGPLLSNSDTGTGTGTDADANTQKSQVNSME